MSPTNNSSSQLWIRGVNIGGWLVLERYITPYQFAITDCHVKGHLCWYPGQVSAPPSHHPHHKLCDLYRCRPVGGNDVDPFPLDEYTLGEAFESNRAAGKQWLNYHFDNFITKEDVQQIKSSGLTHVRVPLPHWVLEEELAYNETIVANTASNMTIPRPEPWIHGDRWQYFVRFVSWCREVGLKVWPDIHTAPGSQNGFDNSGQTLPAASCQGWSNNPDNVERSLRTIRAVTAQIVKDKLQDVVTGFGLLNEPFKDCDRPVYESFIEAGLDIVRNTLGEDMHVYVSDMFLAKTFNANQWWLDPDRYYRTYLDSHYYHVFAEKPRALSPRQHIAYTCEKEYRDVISCCYQSPWKAPSFLWFGGHDRNEYPSKGVQRLIGEWSVAVDTLPVAMLLSVMKGIAENGTAPFFDRELSTDRQDFLKNFAQAQMVAYESSQAGVSGGWFYWTAKMEGGAFAEWDYLRGVQEGWMPSIVKNSHQPSEEVYGSCYDILFRTNDSMSIVHEYPDPSTLPANNWQGVDITDDVVTSHGDSLYIDKNGHYMDPRTAPPRDIHITNTMLWAVVILTVAGMAGVCKWWFKGNIKRHQYASISESEV